jgi:hypothetical protein
MGRFGVGADVVCRTISETEFRCQAEIRQPGSGDTSEARDLPLIGYSWVGV